MTLPAWLEPQLDTAAIEQAARIGAGGLSLRRINGYAMSDEEQRATCKRPIAKNSADQRIIELLRENPRTQKDLYLSIGCCKATVCKSMRDMVARGLIRVQQWDKPKLGRAVAIWEVVA